MDKGMDKNYWHFIIMHSLERVRTLKVEKRTFIIGGIGAIIFICALGFFTFGYFSLFHERKHILEEVKNLNIQIYGLEQKLKKVSVEDGSSKPKVISMAIDNLKMIRQARGRGLSVNFRLLNRGPQGVPLTGTLVMVAKNENLRVPIYQVIPEMSLNQGFPQQPEKGRAFEVSTEKFVEGFFDASPREPFKELTVYLFSPQRELILEKSAAIPEK